MKYNLEDVAKSRGGVYNGLSEIDRNNKEKFTWKCEYGHIWVATAYHVINGSWCPKCSREKLKKTIDDMKLHAKKHGGDCLSTTYIDASTRLTWKCKEGHIFEMVPSRVKGGRWYRICRN